MLELGIKIIESLNMVDYVEDWSRVRSPGRARRRRHKHPQNIRVVAVPKQEAFSIDGGRTLIMHPEFARKLRQQIRERADHMLESAIYGGQQPPPQAGGTTTFDQMNAMWKDWRSRDDSNVRPTV